MEHPLVSIIIPAYNIEDYIKRCLDSLLSQTYQNWEALLIDDGSNKDHTPDICDYYATQDSRIKTFHIPNGGVSNARNYGLDKAQGEWVTFVDGDDFLKPDYIASLLEPTMKSEHIDMVQVGYVCCSQKDGEEKVERFANYVGNNMAMFLNKFHGEVFAKLYRRSIIEDNHLGFDPEVKIYEDLLFTLDYMVFVTQFAFCSSTSYCYWQREDSATATARKKGFQLPQQLPAIHHYAASLRSYTEVFEISRKAADYRWSMLSSNIFYSIRGTGFKKVGREDAKALINIFKHYPITQCQHIWKRKIYLYAFLFYYRLVKLL